MIGRIGALESLPEEVPYPGVRRRSISSDRATVAAYEFDPEASFPLHRHPQEQVTLVQRGQVVFTVAGRRETMHRGGWSVVPPGIEHALTAGPEGASIVVVVTPKRERGDISLGSSPA
jgi:quercetin dioxygenase-like cupin family protein